jgi:2-dehydro-3-deoxyphosphooctonate aldolase (KDO 8-P synthase)
VDALFVEVHEEPARALSDGANALRLDRLGGLLGRLRRIAALVRSEEFSTTEGRNPSEC